MPIPSTQDFLDLEDITQDIVLNRDGSACLILEVAAINFGLFSEKEQEATIYAYAQLLNSLTFPIQIVIMSKRKDISEYLGLLDRAWEKESSPKIKDQLAKYRDFIKSIVRQGNVLDKKFYISLPFSSLELGLSHNMATTFGTKKQNSVPKADLVERARTNLLPKRDHLIRLLARIGLRAHQMNTQELLQFFFEAYNRDTIGVKVTHPNEIPAVDSTS